MALACLSKSSFVRNGSSTFFGAGGLVLSSVGCCADCPRTETTRHKAARRATRTTVDASCLREELDAITCSPWLKVTQGTRRGEKNVRRHHLKLSFPSPLPRP